MLQRSNKSVEQEDMEDGMPQVCYSGAVPMAQYLIYSIISTDFCSAGAINKVAWIIFVDNY